MKIHTICHMIIPNKDRNSRQLRLQLREKIPHLLQTKARHFITDDFVHTEIWSNVDRYSISVTVEWYLRFSFKYDNFTIRFRPHKTVQPPLQEQGSLRSWVLWVQSVFQCLHLCNYVPVCLCTVGRSYSSSLINHHHCISAPPPHPSR